ncbi:dna (cytosine-5)-methyltransferase cmt2 [Quercus suber]|uniref:DNA (cytosine-5-)-methyltransferase n=1 Tax=Quercus suber TaxID=58331 RepID=A0AAW0KZE6_QUESU
MSSSPKSKSESLHLISLEESNSDPVPSSPKVNNDNVAKKTTSIMQCEVVRRRSPRLSPSPSPSQGFRRSPRLSSDGGSLGMSEKSPPPRRRSSTSRFASPQNARSTDRLKANMLLPFNLLVSEYGFMDLTEQKTRRSELNIKVSENLLTWLFVVANQEEEEVEVVLKVDSTSSGFSRLDELPSNMSIPSSGKFNLDENYLKQSLKEATSLSEDENGKNECSFVDSTESGENRCSKRFKATASLEEKRKKAKNISSFIGDPIPDDEAQERWHWRYEMKVIIEFLFALILLDQLALNFEEEEDKIIWNVQCHYAHAKIDNCIFSLGDCAYIMFTSGYFDLYAKHLLQGDGGQKHVGRILEFFKTTDGEHYFRVQWFYRVEDTVIQDEGGFHDKRRLFYSTIMNDNLLDCIISKVTVKQITPKVGLRSNSIPRIDFYYDMEYCVDYSTFRSLVIDNSVKSHNVSSSPDGIKSVHTMATRTFLENVPNCETHGADLALLDLFSGCGGMSTGLCLGAKLSGVNLAARWALDCDKSACKSLKLNHPDTHVRNETAEDFLELLKEWEKLCRRYKVSDVGRTRQSRAETLRSHKSDENSSDDEFSPGEYEVSRLVDICYGKPNRKGKRGLHFKVHWKGYSASEDTWEPIEALSNCQERIQDFIQNGLKLKILPLPGDVDVICGGPPCQGISGYNRFRNIDSPLADDRNRQIVVFMDIVEFLKPKFVLMENVIDILRFDKASLGRYALSRLVRMNYQARLGTIAAGCFGLPQFRLRVFLWGAHPSEKLPQFPLPTHDVIVRYWPPPEFERNTVALDEDQPRVLEKALVLQDAISDLPQVTSFETREEMSYQKPPETDFQRYIRSTRYVVFKI